MGVDAAQAGGRAGHDGVGIAVDQLAGERKLVKGLIPELALRLRGEHAIAGAVLGVQAVLVAAFLLWFRSGDLLFPFVRNVLNFTYLRGTFTLFVEAALRTLYMAFLGEAGGIVIGLILALFTLSKRRVVRAPARAYSSAMAAPIPEPPPVTKAVLPVRVNTFGKAYTAREIRTRE